MKAICFLIAWVSLYSAHCEGVFTDIWKTHYWGGESHSGAGSDLIPTARIREVIPALLQKYQCKTMVDAPCGDLFWMNTVELPVDKYIGIDVVEPLIQLNQILFSNRQRFFIHLDITQQIIPKADLVLCRDCLVHFSYEDIARDHCITFKHLPK